MFCAKCGKEIPEGAAFCPACGAPAQAASYSTSSSGPYNGFDTLTRDHTAQEYWIQRLIAYVIDAIIVYVILFVITAVVAFPFFFAGFSIDFIFGSFTWLGGLIFVLYFTVMESYSGASFGKRFFRLHVVSKSGSHPDLAEAFVRNLSKIYPLLLLLDVIVGLAVSKGYQQKFSDHYMGTKVVRQ